VFSLFGVSRAFKSTQWPRSELRKTSRVHTKDPSGLNKSISARTKSGSGLRQRISAHTKDASRVEGRKWRVEWKSPAASAPPPSTKIPQPLPGPTGRDKIAQGKVRNERRPGFVGETIRALKARDNRRKITVVPPRQDGILVRRCPRPAAAAGDLRPGTSCLGPSGHASGPTGRDAARVESGKWRVEWRCQRQGPGAINQNPSSPSRSTGPGSNE
jgi:hypothetical protein